MCNQLGVTRCAGREKHYHLIVALRGVLRAVVYIAETGHILIKVMPAFTLAVYYNLYFESRALCRRKVYLMSGVAVACANDCLNSACLKAVVIVVLQKQICSRDCYCANLVQCKD